MDKIKTLQSPSFTAKAEQTFAAFESDWSVDQPALIEKHIVNLDPAEVDEVLVELIRIDMELSSGHGRIPATKSYLERFPQLNPNSAAISEILFEEFRLRRAAGENVSAATLGSDYGIDTSNWSKQALPVEGPKSPSLGHKSKNIFESASNVQASMDSEGFPQIPSHFSRFEIVGLLGQGALGRVYLARQDDLADRFVALKVTKEITSEPQCLAMLQHTNIVPVFSVHRVGSLQAICMPFLGVATLADIALHAEHLSQQINGREMISTIADLRGSTLVEKASTPEARNVLQSSANENAADLKFAAVGSRNITDTFGWLFQQVAEGLAYAHKHGVVHGDIKPANILLSEDGHPLLLDFHLSQSMYVDKQQNILGGTLPFMAPEHIQAFVNGGTVTPQCDIYSLGAVFYKLLSGKLPYPVYSGALEDITQKMLVDRRIPAPSLKSASPNIDVDLATIVEKCLHPEAAHRYLSAQELAVDLSRHNENRPLLHAPNRSIQNRFKKWSRRHPGITSLTSVISALAAMLLLTLLVVFYRGQQLRGIEANQQSRTLIDELSRIRLPLSNFKPTAYSLDDTQMKIDILLAEFGGRTSGELETQARLKFLSEQQKRLEKDSIGSVHLLSAGAAIRRARLVPESAERKKLLAQARRENAAASDVSPQLEESRAALYQKSELARLENQLADAERFWKMAAAAPLESDQDRLLAAYELFNTGKFDKQRVDEAENLLRKHIQTDPQNVEAWLLLGNLQSVMGQDAQAIASYSMCIGLNDQVELVFFNRGLAQSKLGDFAGALSDLGRAIELNPHDWSNYANRALAFINLGEFQRALTDLNLAIDLDSPETRLYLRRATVYRELGNEEKAEADYNKFVSLAPVDEDSFVERGIEMIRQGQLPEALKDFDAAINLNPRSIEAWQNKAHVHSELLKDLPAAIEDMTKVLGIAPDNPTTIATRGVLYARAGNRDAALKDAESALAISQSGDTLYRVAGIFSQTSKNDAGDSQKAIALIAQAFLLDPQTVCRYLSVDPDLEPIQKIPNFAEIKEIIDHLEKLGKIDEVK